MANCFNLPNLPKFFTANVFYCMVILNVISIKLNKISSTMKAKNTLHPIKFRWLLNEAANATTIEELHIVVNKIQTCIHKNDQV